MVVKRLKREEQMEYEGRSGLTDVFQYGSHFMMWTEDNEKEKIMLSG